MTYVTPGPSVQSTVNQSSGLPATWSDRTGTGLEAPDGSTVNLSAVSPVTIVSSANPTYGLVGDGATTNPTDNDIAIRAWLAAGVALIAAGSRVKYVLQPGIYKTTGTGYNFPGAADVEWINAQMWYIGTVANATLPFFTHGDTLVNTQGKSVGIDVKNQVAHNYYNRNFIGYRLLNKASVVDNVLKSAEGFMINWQFAADNQCSYNGLSVGQTAVAQTHVEFCSLTVGTPFASENRISGGNFISTTGFNGFGSCWALAQTCEYDTGYHGNSGNFWDGKGSTQLGNVGATWTASTGKTQHFRYLCALTGQEWLCKTAGTSSTTEPSVEPTTGAGTRVDLTSITTSAGSNRITVSSTAGISVGWHMRGTNPLSCFPFDTYVGTVVDGTHLDLVNTAGTAQNAATSSSLYRATFIAPFTDGTAVMVFVGYYRRQEWWNRDAFGAGGIPSPSRRESGVGESTMTSGPYMWPRAANSAAANDIQILSEGTSVTTVKDCRYPVWAVGATYNSGDRVRPLNVGAVFWEALTFTGTSGGSEPVPSSNNVGFTFTDNTVTWIIRAMTDTTTYGDIANHTGALLSTGPKVSTRYFSDPAVGNTVSAIYPAQMGAVGWAGGWNVPGYCKYSGGTLSQSFAAGDWVLGIDGLLATSTAVIGFLLCTDKHRYFQIQKNFGYYTSNRGSVVAFDKALLATNVRTAQTDYAPKLQCGPMTVTGGLILSDPSDTIVAASNLLVGADCPFVFIGVNRGSTGTPIMMSFSSLRVTAMPYSASSGVNPLGYPVRAEIFPYFGTASVRSAGGTPTSGVFKFAGEYIHHSAPATGVPRGWYVSTAGIIAPAWAGGTVYYRGQCVSAGGNIYKSNGSFTSNTTPTAPSGTNQNVVDANATAIVSGDVASWDYMGASGAVTADSNLP